jgi:acyl-CoA synthetase (AMP-forming)/AMP-acid ligase II
VPTSGNEATSICARLREVATRRPDALFCTFLKNNREERITFAELLSRGASYAARYRELGVRPGDLVIIILQHTPHLFYSQIGAMLAGATPSFMPFPTPKQRPELYWADHDTLFAHIEPRLIVTYEENAEELRRVLPGFGFPVLVAGDPVLAGAGAAVGALPGFSARTDDVACLQHSSGTTNLKKGVMLTHRAILAHVESYATALKFGESDSIASWLPLYHDMGFIACFMMSLIRGTHLVALDPFEWVVRPSLLLDAIERHRTTFCWLPNFAFSHIAGGARGDRSWDLSCLRALINCSEPCKPKTFERFASRFAKDGITPAQLQVCYAMAENVFAVTQTVPDRPVRVLYADADLFSRGRVREERGPASIGILSCGVPIERVSVTVTDESKNELPDGVVGEVHVRSSFLFEGYYRLPEATIDKLRGGVYATGDMGFMYGGELYITGRRDDMIIVNGQNYYAHEIEAIAAENESVIAGRAVAIGIEEPQSDATAVVVLTECAPGRETGTLAADVRRAILERVGLAVHAVVPVQPGQLVKTTSGKISRSKNRELYVQGILQRRLP